MTHNPRPILKIITYMLSFGNCQLGWHTLESTYAYWRNGRWDWDIDSFHGVAVNIWNEYIITINQINHNTREILNNNNYKATYICMSYISIESGSMQTWVLLFTLIFGIHHRAAFVRFANDIVYKLIPLTICYVGWWELTNFPGMLEPLSISKPFVLKSRFSIFISFGAYRLHPRPTLQVSLSGGFSSQNKSAI